MADLHPAHRGYAYQDLLIACRLVDVVLDIVVEACVDQKTSPEDCFDDLTTMDIDGTRERIQFKYTQSHMAPLALSTFTNRSRRLRLDQVIKAALADSESSRSGATRRSFRVVFNNTAPTDTRLRDVLVPLPDDLGPFVAGMSTTRLAFSPDVLWAQMHRRPPTALRWKETPFAGDSVRVLAG